MLWNKGEIRFFQFHLFDFEIKCVVVNSVGWGNQRQIICVANLFERLRNQNVNVNVNVNVSQ